MTDLFPPIYIDPPKVDAIGVSGTREQLSVEQQHAFFDQIVHFLRLGAREVHHGACVGADTFVHHQMLSNNWNVHVHAHPPLDEKFSAMRGLVRHVRRIDHEPLVYKDRNQAIVDATDVLIAAPRYPEDHPQSKRSGTWQTIRMAKAADKLVVVCHFDGKVETYHDPQAKLA